MGRTSKRATAAISATRRRSGKTARKKQPISDGNLDAHILAYIKENHIPRARIEAVSPTEIIIHN